VSVKFELNEQSEDDTWLLVLRSRFDMFFVCVREVMVTEGGIDFLYALGSLGSS
jgi:hypothetical protein